MSAARYIGLYRPRKKRAAFDLDGERLMPDSISVIVEDDSPVPTGLYDSSGVELYRVTDRRPVGFTAKHED